MNFTGSMSAYVERKKLGINQEILNVGEHIVLAGEFVRPGSVLGLHCILP